ncbi:iron-containing alcohol dehydrogenase family protein [Faecalicatena fissicatena]|uniref:Iron-containing alcohol dehydrogenase family protein n=1 Tax=Faecalicatena fissicatena TaxID=290055 RepID=A0ABS2E7Q5_9FIRM|nr:iron-containing alcohol dehydrogenase family protein [Faecalicatena fissicatena]MBM6737668.1 iron-containing alcohol dehydrogenase family protein [Faecalicatena fissicatena]
MKAYSVFFANYTIGEDAYGQVPQVCLPFGKRIFLIGGRRAMDAAEGLLGKALEGSGLVVLESVEFGADCTYRTIDRWAQRAKELGADMIFGMGGGKALDTAKGAAERAGLPVFTFPTIAATCAATTALSVVYREDGNFDSFYFYDKPARHCFINTRIIADAPCEYLRAGMGDTMGKFFECHFAARGDHLDHSSALGREISNLCYGPLLEHGVQALVDCRRHEPSFALQQAVLANIVSTGMVSLMVLDDYNCAIAHSVYYGLVLLPGFEEKYLHGDVVAYGVLVQLAVDKDWDRMREVKGFMKELGIPSTLREMEVPLDREYLRDVLRETVTGPDMEHIPYPVTEDMIFEAMREVEELEG